MNTKINFISFKDEKPPVETPIWVKQNTGHVSIGAVHNNGMGCSGIAVGEFKDGGVLISNNKFLMMVTHWAPIESQEEVISVLKELEGD